MNFTFNNPRVQYFSLPSNVIYRLWKFPKSSAAALKLYQTCKYFYYKQNAAFFDEILYFNGYRRECRARELKLKENVLLFSLQNALKIVTTFPPFLNTSSKMLRHHNITSLSLYWITLKFEEFLILTSMTTIKKFILYDSIIRYSNAIPLTIDAVLASLPNVEYFRYENREDDYPRVVLENLNKLTFWNKLKEFHISIIHELADTFDPTLFCKFIRNNLDSGGDIQVDACFTNAMKGKALAQELKKMEDNWDDKDNIRPSVGISSPYFDLY